MFPGVNPRQMRAAMQKMGIQQEEVEAEEVIIRTKDKEIVISNPQVVKVNMMGQKNYQVSGEETVRELSSAPDISEEDVQTVVDATGVSADVAKAAILENNGDLAATIMGLKK